METMRVPAIDSISNRVTFKLIEGKASMGVYLNTELVGEYTKIYGSDIHYLPNQRLFNRFDLSEWYINEEFLKWEIVRQLNVVQPDVRKENKYRWLKK